MAALPLGGKTMVVTGGTSGIGEATARGLALRGATVVVSGHDREQGRSALERIASVAQPDRVHLLISDFASLQGVRRLAAQIKERFERVDVLFNNAGVDVGRRAVTSDGLELTFAVNYLAPFLLTNLLLDVLRRSAPARILNAASGAHKGGSVDFEDLQSERHFGQRAYNNSKLELVLFTCELARRLGDTGVTANCVDPGFVRTGLGATMPLGYRLVGGLLWPFMASPERGAATAIWAATDPDLVSVTGAYFKRRRQIAPSAKAHDRATAERLWKVSESLAHLS